MMLSECMIKGVEIGIVAFFAVLIFALSILVVFGVLGLLIQWIGGDSANE